MSKNDIRNTYNNVYINNKGAVGSLKELAGEVRKLYNELALLPIGSEEYSKKLEELNAKKSIYQKVQSEIKQTGQAVERLGESSAKAHAVIGKMTAFMAGIWAQLGAGIAQAVGRVFDFQKIITSTDGSSDRLAKTMTGLRFSLDTLWKSIASGNFSNLVTRMLEAAEAGIKYAETLDKIEDRTRALGIIESDRRVEYERLKVIERDASLSKEERINAGKEALKIEEEGLKIRMSIAEQNFKNEMEQVSRITGLGEATIKNYFKEYEAKKAVREEAERYLELLKEEMDISVTKGGATGGAVDQAQIQKLSRIRSEIASISYEAKAYSVIIKGIGLLSTEGEDSEMSRLENAWKNLGEIRQNSIRETARIKITLGKLNKGILDEEENEAERRRKELEAKQREHAKYLLGITEDLFSVRIQLIRDGRAREIAEAEYTTRKKIEAIKGETEQEVLLRNNLEALLVRQKLNINTKYDQLQQEADIKELERLKDLAEKKLKITKEENEKARKQIEDDVTKAENLFRDSDDRIYHERKEALLKWRDAALAAAGDDIEKIAKVWDIFNQRMEDLNKAQIQRIKDSIVNTLNALGNVLNQFQAMEDAKSDAYLAKYESNIAQRRKILEDNFNRGLISRIQYENALKKLDEEVAAERAKINKEKAEREYQYAKVMIVIQTAISVASAIALAATSSKHWIEAIVAIAGSVATVIAEMSIASSKLQQAKVGQYAKGRFNVIGADDGRTYSSVPFTGPAKTGIYSRPALIAERGSELIVDAPTTRNIQMNYPWIIEAIQRSRVDQFASGRIPEVARSGSTIDTNQVIIDINSMNENLDRIYEILKHGTTAKVVWTDIEKFQNDINQIRNDVAR